MAVCWARVPCGSVLRFTFPMYAVAFIRPLVMKMLWKRLLSRWGSYTSHKLRSN